MKNYMKVLVLLLCLIMITGCGGISKKERNKIISKLTGEKIISKSWKLLDYYTEYSWGQEHYNTNGYGYLYKDKNGQIYEIYIGSFHEKKSDTEEIKKVSNISKYKISYIDESLKPGNYTGKWVVFNSDIIADEKENKYKTEDRVDTRYELSKYIRDESSKEEYTITKTNETFLFFKYKKYKLEKTGKKDA